MFFVIKVNFIAVGTCVLFAILNSFPVFGYKKTAVKVSIFTTVCFKFYSILDRIIQAKFYQNESRRSSRLERKCKRNRRGLGILPCGNLLRADAGCEWRISPVSGHRQCLLCFSIIRDNHSYPDFFIIPTIIGKADKHAVFRDKGRDNFLSIHMKLHFFNTFSCEKSRDNLFNYFRPYSFFKISSSLTQYLGISTPAITSFPIDFSIAFRFCSVSA